MNARPSVLVVDDDAGVRRTLGDILTIKGYEPHVCSGGREAAALAGSVCPDVALIDLRLEGASGLRVMQELRVVSPETECIVLTGHASQDSAIEAMNLGAYAYVQKPFDVDHLLFTIRRAFEKRQVARALAESEARFRTIYENAVIGLYRTTPEGRIVMANPTLVRMLGYASLEDLVSRDLTADGFAPSYSRESFCERVEREGTISGLETVWRRKDGTPIYVRENAVAVRDEGGQVVYYDGSVEDITARRQAEEERERLTVQLAERARQVGQIIAALPDGVALLFPDGRIGLANPVAQEILMTLAGVGTGDTITHLGPYTLDQAAEGDSPTRWRTLETDEAIFDFGVWPIEPGPEAWVLIIRDVTEERRTQERILQQDRLAAVGQLAAGIAHDFNNILAVITLYAQLMAKSLVSPRDREWIATINEQAHHAARLVQQILDFSRQAMIERRPLDLVPLLKEHVKLLQRTIPEHIQIELVCDSGGHLVLADPTRIRQVVTNLTVNARDAMPSGGRLRIGIEHLQITTRTETPLGLTPGPWVRLSVSDTGSGIASDVLPHIFEPFYSTKGPGKGSGLGLAQVHGIVGQHEGAIDVRTQVGEGTTFDVYLPLLPAEGDRGTSCESDGLPQGEGETILIVEDQEVVRTALVTVVEQLNYRVIGAANGREALALLADRGSEIKLILSDIVMPVLGGATLLRQLRNSGVTIPVVLMTGHPQDEDWGDLKALGATACIAKPPSVDDLARALADVLGR